MVRARIIITLPCKDPLFTDPLYPLKQWGTAWGTGDLPLESESARSDPHPQKTKRVKHRNEGNFDQIGLIPYAPYAPSDAAIAGAAVRPVLQSEDRPGIQTLALAARARRVAFGVRLRSGCLCPDALRASVPSVLFGLCFPLPMFSICF